MAIAPNRRRPDAWAVVTGASSGIGREFALALAERGKPVLAVARDGELWRALRWAAAGWELEPLSAVPSRPEGVESLPAAAGARSAGSQQRRRHTAASSPSPGANANLRLNVEAVVAVTHGLLPAMSGARRACQRRLDRRLPADARFATHAAGRRSSASRALSEEPRGSGVRVSIVAPESPGLGSDAPAVTILNAASPPRRQRVVRPPPRAGAPAHGLSRRRLLPSHDR
jgi:NADP-dependent 3-hydroxy acid dehydrogenase YdfG